MIHFGLCLPRKTSSALQSNTRVKRSVQVWPSSLAEMTVSSCKSWSAQGLESTLDDPLVVPGEVELVSVSLVLTSMKPITKHRTTARTGVRTDRRAMTASRGGEKRIRATCAWVYLRWSGVVKHVLLSGLGLCQIRHWSMRCYKTSKTIKS